MFHQWTDPPAEPTTSLLAQIPTGPIDHDPIIGGTYVARGERLRLLLEALDDVELGAYDHRLLEHYAHVWDTSTVLTIASWIRRARLAGEPDPYRERVAGEGGR